MGISETFWAQWSYDSNAQKKVINGYIGGVYLVWNDWFTPCISVR